MKTDSNTSNNSKENISIKNQDSFVVAYIQEEDDYSMMIEEFL